jgi:hypothetical protein
MLRCDHRRSSLETPLGLHGFVGISPAAILRRGAMAIGQFPVLDHHEDGDRP